VNNLHSLESLCNTMSCRYRMPKVGKGKESVRDRLSVSKEEEGRTRKTKTKTPPPLVFFFFF
jgi:hypothetical protein